MRMYREAPPSPVPRTSIPRTFVHGLAPRSPRCLDEPEEFQLQVMLEGRVASSSARRMEAVPDAADVGDDDDAVAEFYTHHDEPQPSPKRFYRS